MTDHVEIRREGAVQILRLNRLEKKNALTGAMYAALAEALNEANRSDDIAVTVLFGQPGVFSAGNDIAEFLAVSQGGGGLQGFGFAFLKALAECEKPLIAAVDGLAVGVGATLFLHCDLVYASPRAVFHTPFVDLGLLPEAGSSLLGPLAMGYVRAFEFLVMGVPWTAEQAKEAGLVNHIAASEKLESEALSAARSLAEKPREALKIAKRLLRGDPALVKQRMQEEGVLFLERVKSDEARTAFTAFLQKSARGPHEKMA